MSEVIIRVVDLETTGFRPPDAGVCEIGFCDVVARRTDPADAPVSWTVVGGFGEFIRPDQPIPPEVSAIHHIIDEDVASALPWPVVAPTITTPRMAGGIPIVALAAHSAKFEQLFIDRDLAGDKPWICSYKCALRLWPDAPSHSNQALRYWRRPEGLDRETASFAHRAFPDAYVTAFHVRDMLNSGATVEQLVEWSSQPALQVRCHIGKWRGTPWRDVDWGFLEWVSVRDFDEDVLFTVRHEMERREKEQAVAAGAGDDSEEHF
jgi:exodeoxyribonuclease X